MSEMVERVARALEETYGKALCWQDMARAAIEAMREPTPEMLAAGFGHHYRLETTLGRQKAERDARAMIDAALNAEKTPDAKAPGA